MGEERFPGWHGTTIVAVRKGGKVVVAGDGQVSLGQTVIKGIGAQGAPASTPGGQPVICGFAGSTADAFTLLERLEKKLEAAPGQLQRAAVELAKDWRTDKYLRNLEAMLIVSDGRELLPSPAPATCSSPSTTSPRSARAATMRWRRRGRSTTASSTPRRSPAGRWRSPPRSASTPTGMSCRGQPGCRLSASASDRSTAADYPLLGALADRSRMCASAWGDPAARSCGFIRDMVGGARQRRRPFIFDARRSRRLGYIQLWFVGHHQSAECDRRLHPWLAELRIGCASASTCRSADRRAVSSQGDRLGGAVGLRARLHAYGHRTIVIDPDSAQRPARCAPMPRPGSGDRFRGLDGAHRRRADRCSIDPQAPTGTT